jgi:hypothetical protein
LILGQANYFGLNLFLELVSDINEALLKPGIDRRAIYFLNKPAITRAWANFRFPLKMIARVHLEISFLTFLELPPRHGPTQRPNPTGLRVTKVFYPGNRFKLDTADPLNIIP